MTTSSSDVACEAAEPFPTRWLAALLPIVAGLFVAAALLALVLPRTAVEEETFVPAS